MLKLKILGSSSKGNCFVLYDNDNNLIIDCGCKNTIEKVDITKTMGILISHCHLDHCRDVRNIKEVYNDKFYSNKETLDTLPIIDSQKCITEYKVPFEINQFKIVPFKVYHDVPNNGYLIKHMPSGMKTLYIIDTSSVSNLHFKDIDVFIIEANHSYEWLLEKNELDVKDYRTYGNQGHLAVEDTIEFLLNNINHNTKKIILTHIASSCEEYLETKEKVELAINNKSIEVIAIDPHLKETLEIILKEDININFD